MTQAWLRLYAPTNLGQLFTNKKNKHSFYLGDPHAINSGNGLSEKLECYQLASGTTLKEIRKAINLGILPNAASSARTTFDMRPSTFRSEILFAASKIQNIFGRHESDRMKYMFAVLRESDEEERIELIDNGTREKVVLQHTDKCEGDIFVTPQIIEVEDEPLTEIFGQVNTIDLVVVPLMVINPSNCRTISFKKER